MNDRAFEDLVRTSLAGAADAAPSAPPLPRLRVRARQAALVAAGGLVAVAGALGAVRVGGEVFAKPDLVPVGPGEVMMDARGAGGEYPCELADTGSGRPAGSCIATGERDGVRWTLGASLERNGDLCMILWSVGGPGAGVAGSSCNAYEPETIGLEQTGMGDLPLLAYGHVPAGAESLYLEHGGDSFELEVYPAPPGFPTNDGFYLVWLPDDASRIVAYDAGGEVVATRELDSSRPDLPPGETGYATVAEGTHEGVPWVLETYSIDDGGREITCTRVLVGPHLTRPHGPCDATFGSSSAVGVGAFSAPELPGYIALGGVTRSTSRSITFETGGGSIDATVHDAPAGLDETLRFFVAFLLDEKSKPLEATIVIRNAAGEVLERRGVCVPGGEAFSC